MAGFSEFELAHKAFLVDGSRTLQGRDVTLAGGLVTDYPEANGTRVPEGTVVVKDSDDDLYYLADDAVNGDRNAAASVASLEAADTDWDGETYTITVTYPDGRVVSKAVVAAGTDDTTAEMVTLINNDTTLGGHVVASGTNGNPLTITTVAKGNVHLKVTSTLASAFGANGQEDDGVEADYRVVTKQVDTKDLDGSDYEQVVPNLLAGNFDASELSNLTDEAKAVLTGRGSRFE